MGRPPFAVKRDARCFVYTTLRRAQGILHSIDISALEGAETNVCRCYNSEVDDNAKGALSREMPPILAIVNIGLSNTYMYQMADSNMILITH